VRPGDDDDPAVASRERLHADCGVDQGVDGNRVDPAQRFAGQLRATLTAAAGGHTSTQLLTSCPQPDDEQRRRPQGLSVALDGHGGLDVPLCVGERCGEGLPGGTQVGASSEVGCQELVRARAVCRAFRAASASSAAPVAAQATSPSRGVVRLVVWK
jgi:hypothetical protein